MWKNSVFKSYFQFDFQVFKSEYRGRWGKIIYKLDMNLFFFYKEKKVKKEI